jgi:hypothetical protein
MWYNTVMREAPVPRLVGMAVGNGKEDVAFAEAFRRDNPSPLQEKLKALGRD